MRYSSCILTLLLLSQTLLAQSPPGSTISSYDLSPNSKLPPRNVIKQVPGQPPSITYGRTREGTATIGSQSIDDGVEWQGRKAYFTLFNELFVVDAKTKKTLWTDVGNSFWNTITFVNIAQKEDKPHWIVALGTVEYPKYQQQYDLETGKQLELIGGPPTPTGVAFKPRMSFEGRDGKYDKPVYQLVNSPEEWTQLRDKLFGGKRPNLPEATDIDFKKESLLVYSEGTSVELAVENDERLLLRINIFTTQVVSGSFAPKQSNFTIEHRYGLFVLPRRPGKPIILERNEQPYLGGPPMWKEFIRLGK